MLRITGRMVRLEGFAMRRETLVALYGPDVAGILLSPNSRGFAMKRDDDYLRSLLIEMQDDDHWLVLSDLTNDSSEEDYRRHFHILMLADAGLVAPYARATFRLTDAGQTFASQIRDDTAWSRVKGAASAAAGHSVALLADIARAYAVDALRKMGVPI